MLNCLSNVYSIFWLLHCLKIACMSGFTTNYVYGTQIQTRKGFDGIDKITVQQFFVVVSYNSMGFNSYKNVFVLQNWAIKLCQSGQC